MVISYKVVDILVCSKDTDAEIGNFVGAPHTFFGEATWVDLGF